MIDIKGSVAVITGASGGMGRETAFLLGKHGVKLVLAARKVQPLEAVADQIIKSGGDAIVCPTDVSKNTDVQNMINKAVEKFGRTDFLICTAGVAMQGPLEEISELDWDTMMSVNLKGVFLCSKAVLPIFFKQKRGHIINIASLAGTVGSPNLSAYCASKAGVLRFSDAISKELRSKNIKVSTITPGSTNTGFGGSEKEEKSWKMSPKDIAIMVHNLVSSADNLLISDVQMRPLKTSI